MMRQFLTQAIAEEPADGDVDLRLTHQLAVVHDGGEQTVTVEACLTAKMAHAVVGAFSLTVNPRSTPARRGYPSDI